MAYVHNHNRRLAEDIIQLRRSGRLCGGLDIRPARMADMVPAAGGGHPIVGLRSPRRGAQPLRAQRGCLTVRVKKLRIVTVRKSAILIPICVLSFFVKP